MSPRFLQIHTLTSYSAALLNRDDAGFAKRIPFGGAVRTRISSQCLKRHWRMFRGEASLQEIPLENSTAPMSIRSRATFERHIFEPLCQDGVQKDMARAVTSAVLDEALGKSEKRKKSQEKETEAEHDEGLRTGQVTVLGRPEIDYLLSLARQVAQVAPSPTKAGQILKERLGREGRQNLKEMRLGAGLDAALFGRMVTSDLLARPDAALHVAHAFTVHAENAEPDYFSAVDDLLSEGEQAEQGSGHIGSTELTSGLFYGYVVADLPTLVSNLEACREEDWDGADRRLSAEVVRRLVRIVATVTPGAKLGSTAPYSVSHLVLVESGRSQPRSLANAFLKPIAERPDLLENTYRALAAHLVDLDAMYGRKEERRWAAIGPIAELTAVVPDASRMNLDTLAGWVRDQIVGTA